MDKKSAIPAVIVVPGESMSIEAIHAVATSYAHSGHFLNKLAQKNEQIVFTFPAMVCSSFGVELFLKFFIAFDNTKTTPDKHSNLRGHELMKLWNRIKPDSQELIIGMFRNPSKVPSKEGIDGRRRLFLEALSAVGPEPFVDWRYVHEIGSPRLMSHEAIVEILDALGYAANHVLGKSAPV